MSRPRSRSPRYRRFPWEEPDFDPHKVVAELDGNLMERGHRSRQGPEDWDYYREDNNYPEGNRRSPPFPDDRQHGLHRHPDQEEFYHRRSSPRHDGMGYDQRLSPPLDGGRDGDRRRGGFRENFQHFENRARSPHSPPRLMRERLPPTPRAESEHRQRDPGTGWRREEQGRGRGRFRDISPGEGRDRGRRSSQGPVRGRRREDSQHDRTPPFKRQRRDMDGGDHPGFRNEQHFGEQRFSLGTPRGGFRGAPKGTPPRGNARHSGPLVIEHGHGFTDNREPPRWEKFDDRRDFDPGLDGQRSPRPMRSSQERFRSPDNRPDGRDDNRGPPFQGNWRDSNYQESRRSPTPQERPHPMRFGNRDGFMNRRGRGGHHPGRGRGGRGQGGRFNPQRNQPRFQQSSQGFQDHEEQRPAFRHFREQSFDDPAEGDPDWAEEERTPQWKQDRPGSLDRHLTEPQRPRPWNNQKPKNIPDVSQETLTIKVDMSRPMNQNSSLCYSSDRQLSLDLVNVGRQRLDFLPMLEHSGTYRETAMHTGTFAQEIITLVHYVKDQYFRDDGVTLNQRFSAPQKGGNYEEETEELTLDERFSSNRGFSLNLDSLLDDDEPLFFRLGQMQPVRGPGDLRHDLERRRQERLEGVRVTISGNIMSQQRPPGTGSPPDLDYSDKDDLVQDEDEFSSWSEDQSRRREGNMGPRRGTSFNPNFGSQRRNHRFGNRLGPVRRQQNPRGNPAASHW